VYIAEQRSLAREVAIKTVKDPLDASQLDALLWEGAIAGHLDHPGVTPVHQVGKTADGETVLVMKRIVGLRWSDLLERGDEVWSRFPMLPRDRLRAHLEILMEIARTIHFAHLRKVLHLDIKPDNVMIGELGEVYVVDWGVATTMDRSGGRSGFVGTPMFAAPEVVNGEPIGPWTDVYLLGATLHFLLTSEPRHRGASILEVVEAASRSEACTYSAAVPFDLGELANRATARDPKDRPPDALAFRAAIATHLEHTASRSLTHDGERLLTELGALEEPSRAIRLVTEASFAFRTALDRWPENSDAAEGLVRATRASLAIEIKRENLPAARELAAELPDIPEDLAARLAGLEALVAERTRSAEELKRLKDESDLRLGGRERVKLFVALLAVSAVALAVLTLSVSDASMMSVFVTLAPPIGGVVVLAVLVLWLRHGLFQNAMGRRLVVMLFAALGFMALHRSAVVLFPLDAAGTEMRSELLLVAAFGVGLGTFVARRAGVVAALPMLGAAAVTAWPSAAEELFNLCGLLTMIALLFVLRGVDGATVRVSAQGPANRS
jgi:serine/threonine-protein kinase